MSFSVQNPKNQGHRCSRAGEHGCLSSSIEKKLIFFHLLFYPGHPQMVQCPPTLVIFFTESSESNAPLFPRYRRDHSEIISSQPSEHPMAQSRWHIKLTSHQADFYYPNGDTLRVKGSAIENYTKTTSIERAVPCSLGGMVTELTTAPVPKPLA